MRLRSYLYDVNIGWRTIFPRPCQFCLGGALPLTCEKGGVSFSTSAPKKTEREQRRRFHAESVTELFVCFFLVGCLVKMTSCRGVGMDRKPDKVGGRSQESSGDKPTRLFSTGCEFDLTVELSYFTVIGFKS